MGHSVLFTSKAPPPPIISRIRNITPGIVRPIARSQTSSFQKCPTFTSAQEYYLQNENLLGEHVEVKDLKQEGSLEIKADQTNKPKVLVPSNKRRKLYSTNQDCL